MKICTGKGDRGFSSLADGNALPKNSPCFELMGDIDELSCVLGLAKTAGGDLSFLEESQKALSKIMSYIACENEKYLMNEAEADIPLAHADYDFEEFILPGKTELSARLDFARAVCRRAERKYATFYLEKKADKNALMFLNRLSDALYILARRAESQGEK